MASDFHLVFYPQKGIWYHIARFFMRSPIRSFAHAFFKLHCLKENGRLKRQIISMAPSKITIYGADFISAKTIREIKRKILVLIHLTEDPCSIDFFDKFKIAKLADCSEILIPDEAWRYSLIFAGDIPIRYEHFE